MGVEWGGGRKPQQTSLLDRWADWLESPSINLETVAWCVIGLGSLYLLAHLLLAIARLS